MQPNAPKRRVNSLLVKVIIISVALHVVIGLILGGITIIDHIIPDKAQFDEAPETPEEIPPVKIEVKPPKPPKLEPKPSVRPINNLPKAEIKVDVPDLQQDFTVSSGFGTGGSQTSGGLLGIRQGAMKLKMPEIKFMGFKAKAERIIFIIDASRNMLVDAKGGLNSFKIIKEKVYELIGNLPAGSLFNVMLTDDMGTSLRFKPKLVPAGTKTQTELVNWLAPINSDASLVGVKRRGAYKTPLKNFTTSPMVEDGLMKGGAVWQGNQSAYFTQLALEMNPDAIFHICSTHSGFDKVKYYKSEPEPGKKANDYSDNKKWQAAMAAYKAEIPIMQKKVDEILAKQNAARKKKGLPPRVMRKNQLRDMVAELGLKWKNPMPRPGQFGTKGNKSNLTSVSPAKVQEHFAKLIKKLYTNNNKEAPSINVLLLLAKGDKLPSKDEKAIRQFTRVFKGKHKIVEGFKKFQAAAEETE